MEGAPVELTDIQHFYKNETVFLTGATGFIGKLLLEKVLRALPVKKVLLLIRPKKSVDPSRRLQTIFEAPIFDGLKRNNPDVLRKVEAIHGDIEMPMLGLSNHDLEKFLQEVTVIFHCAATVRFDEHIKLATRLNVRATKDLVDLAKKLKRIKTFAYVGTAYSNSNRKEIKEQVYPSKISAENLIAVCEALDDDTLCSMTKTLIGDFPNNYTFTKQVTEDYISREGQGLPICICRPSIVVATAAEPLAGFVENAFSLSGFSLVNGLGICRITYYKKGPLDVIPADYVVNETIAAGWHCGETFKNQRIQIPVYHICSSLENPIGIDEISGYGHINMNKIPSVKSVMYPLFFFTTCKYNYLFGRFIMHTMVAFVADLVLQLKGKKPMLSAGMRKLHSFQETYEYFTTNSFYWHMDNHYKMLKKMSFKDRELFNFNIKALNWQDYFVQQAKGVRIYMAGDPMSTLPEGVKRMKYLRNVFFISLLAGTIVVYGLGKILLFRLLPLVFGGIIYILRSLVSQAKVAGFPVGGKGIYAEKIKRKETRKRRIPFRERRPMNPIL